MYWYYWKFPREPVSAENFETRGINTIILHYHYRVDPKLGKGVCIFIYFLCKCSACIAQLDIYWLSNIAPSYQPSRARVENCY